MTENQANTNHTECLNCHEQLPASATYCPNCSQKKTTGLISLKEFIQNFLNNVFNLDSRIVQTVKWLFIPAKLTQEYFKGKHKTYSHPIRLYLVMSLIFFAILNFVNGDENLSFMMGGVGDSLKKMIAKEEGKQALTIELDTFSQRITKYFQEEEVKLALDSLKKFIETPTKRDSFRIEDASGKKLYIDPLDVANLSWKELAPKYGITGFWNNIKTKQEVHLQMDKAAFFRQLGNNIPLMFLVMMPFLALMLKLLYIRRQRFYVEHLVLNFHHHAFMFFLFSIIFLLPESTFSYMIPIGFSGTLIFLYLAMKKYYGQGHVKTFIKFIGFNIFYLGASFVVFILTTIISFLLF